MLFKQYKALFLFRIRDDAVNFRVWQSTTDIEGSVLLRGGLENLELEVVGHEHNWTIHEMKEPVLKAWIVDSLVGRYL